MTGSLLLFTAAVCDRASDANSVTRKTADLGEIGAKLANPVAGRPIDAVALIHSS